MHIVNKLLFYEFLITNAIALIPIDIQMNMNSFQSNFNASEDVWCAIHFMWSYSNCNKILMNFFYSHRFSFITKIESLHFLIRCIAQLVIWQIFKNVDANVFVFFPLATLFFNLSVMLVLFSTFYFYFLYRQKRLWNCNKF